MLERSGVEPSDFPGSGAEIKNTWLIVNLRNRLRFSVFENTEQQGSFFLLTVYRLLSSGVSRSLKPLFTTEKMANCNNFCSLCVLWEVDKFELDLERCSSTSLHKFLPEQAAKSRIQVFLRI